MKKLKVESRDFEDRDIVSSILLMVIREVAHLEAQVSGGLALVSSFPLVCIHKAAMLLFEQT